MSRVLEELLSLLELERIEENLFRGESQDLGFRALFGGQVLGQGLSAASRTVETARKAHSLHAYFLRAGDASLPVVYMVDRVRDGGSFTTRRVVAIQKGQPILTMMASFQLGEEGFTHGDGMPQVPPPEDLVDEHTDWTRNLERIPEPLRERLTAERPLEFRQVEPLDPFHPEVRAPQRAVWFRARGKLPDDPQVHRYLLAYASDYSLLGVALQPHGVSFVTRRLQLASIDHALWFHDELRLDDWLLYTMDSPWAGNGRGLTRGRIFSRDGRLVASVTQEGLMRMREEKR